MDRCPESPVRLPHSPDPAETFQVIPFQDPVSSESPGDMLAGLCSCLLGVCGCVTGLDLCAITPKLCNLLAGLCGSLYTSGVPPRQDHSSLADQVWHHRDRS